MKLGYLLALALPLSLGACSQTVIEKLGPGAPGDSPTGDDDSDGGATTGDDAGAAKPDAATVTNPPPSNVTPPQIVSYGGRVLSTPRIVPIFYPNDAYAAQLTTLAGKLGASDYWKQATSEYGVGKISVGTAIHLSQTAPSQLTDDQIATWLKSMLDGTHAAFGTPNTETIYTIFYPSQTSIDLQGTKSCQQFGGYHNETQVGATKISYAVLPRCSGADVGLSDIDALTVAASHEWVEAVTDPLPFTSPAYAYPDDDHLVWAIFPLSEVGDMCTFNAGADIKPADLGFMVQRIWSNAAAKAGHHPCVPETAGETYFNTAPLFDGKVTIDFGQGQTAPTSGVRVPLGQSKTIELQLFSEGTTGEWSVDVVDYNQLYNRTSPDLSFTMPVKTGKNGDKLSLTIKRNANGGYGGSAFVITSTLGKTQQNLWVGFAAN